MSITFNGTAVDEIIFNGTEVKKVVLDGTTVFEKTLEDWVGVCTIGSSYASTWDSVSSDAVETGNLSNTFKPASTVSFSITYAYFKVDVSKYKYATVTGNGTALWIYNSTSETLSNTPYNSVVSVTLGTDIDLTAYDGKYVALYNSTSGKTGTITLHN